MVNPIDRFLEAFANDPFNTESTCRSELKYNANQCKAVVKALYYSESQAPGQITRDEAEQLKKIGISESDIKEMEARATVMRANVLTGGSYYLYKARIKEAIIKDLRLIGQNFPNLIPSILPRVRKGLNEIEPYVVVAAIQTVAALNDKGSLGQLRKLANSQSELIKAAANEAIKKLSQ